MLLDAIILASGGAKRDNTKHAAVKRKYMLTADGVHSLLFLTIMRAIGISPHRIVIITDEDRIKFVNGELEKAKRTESYLNLVERNDLIFVVIKEPEHKGAFLSAALGAYVLNHQANRNIAVFLPSEQLISNEAAFRQAIKSAYSISKKGYVITLGIATSSPATNHGYIETENLKSKKWYTIKRVINHPDLESAEKYIKDENYYYNSGILVFNPAELIGGMETHTPDLAYRMKKIVNIKASSIHFPNMLADIYEGLKGLSMEDGIFISSKNAVMIPAGFNWSGCRDWPAVFNGGVNGFAKARKNVISLRTKKARSDIDEMPMDFNEADGFIAVETHDSFLICDKNNADDVKALNDLIEGNNVRRYSK